MSQHSSRGGAVVGILLTILILGVLAVSALVATGLFIAHNVRVTESPSRGQATLETPVGSIRVRETTKFDPAALGLPVYPGAVRHDDSRDMASLRLDFGERHKEIAMAAAEYSTDDSLDRVYDFYHHQLPHWMFREERHGGFHLELTEGGYKKMVVIHRENGETRIGLASIGEPESN